MKTWILDPVIKAETKLQIT